jgi:hypothetical protein
VYRRAASFHPGVHRGCAALTGRVRLEAGATVR